MTAIDSTEIDCQIERALIRVLLYFEVFAYPLKAKEVFAFSSILASSEGELSEKLASVVKKGVVFKFGDYFQTQNNPDWVEKRLACNQAADLILPLARRNARFIGSFPFIRGVFVSGSLSKGCLQPDGDIDYFLVTEPGRLWLARTLLVLYKKIFLFNSHKHFCVNYFIDTEHLEIEEQNLFTATETVTLVPMYGLEAFQAFCATNAWAWAQYPNAPKRDLSETVPHSRPLLKRMLEGILAGKFGAWLDTRAMRLTVGFWKRKFKYFDEETFGVALKSRRYVSKHHPLHFQNKVLERFERRVKELGV